MQAEFDASPISLRGRTGVGGGTEEIATAPGTADRRLVFPEHMTWLVPVLSCMRYSSHPPEQAWRERTSPSSFSSDVVPSVRICEETPSPLSAVPLGRLTGGRTE